MWLDCIDIGRYTHTYKVHMHTKRWYTFGFNTTYLLRANVAALPTYVTDLGQNITPTVQFTRNTCPGVIYFITFRIKKTVTYPRKKTSSTYFSYTQPFAGVHLNRFH